jgi:hypothetical protein
VLERSSYWLFGWENPSRREVREGLEIEKTVFRGSVGYELSEYIPQKKILMKLLKLDGKN